MCAAGRPEEDEYGVRILAGKYSDAYLQRASVQRDNTVVIWRGRHVAEPTDLEPEEASGYWLEVLDVARALQHNYRPLKMNYETLGNSLPHLHVPIPCWRMSPLCRRSRNRSSAKRQQRCRPS